MFIREAILDDALAEKLIALSERWEAEHNCWGYGRNGRANIEGSRIFIAEEDGEVLGYLFGQSHVAEEANAVMAAGTFYFEIDELYVVPERRSTGIGGRLFRFVEDTVRAEGVSQLMLSTAAKEYKRILHFYIEEMGMDSWTALLFKKL